MSTTSSEFLIDGLSFVTKTDGDSATVVRTSTGSAITQKEKDAAGSFYDSSTAVSYTHLTLPPKRIV